MSGTPVNVTFSSTGLNAPGNPNSPNQVGEFKVLHGINVGNLWFDTTLYTPLAQELPLRRPANNDPQWRE